MQHSEKIWTGVFSGHGSWLRFDADCKEEIKLYHLTEVKDKVRKWEWDSDFIGGKGIPVNMNVLQTIDGWDNNFPFVAPWVMFQHYDKTK